MIWEWDPLYLCLQGVSKNMGIKRRLENILRFPMVDNGKECVKIKLLQMWSAFFKIDGDIKRLKDFVVI